jgi:hypothetical protein
VLLTVSLELIQVVVSVVINTSMISLSNGTSLLDTWYCSAIAKRRRVFKVETIGDCYVAVTGLPEPRKDHATAMARFAKDCLAKFNELVSALEITLGPDTGDLNLRTGLHSGPVTAGVLRGDKSRFQLFGDTVNTAARMESNGERNRIHMSQDTADLLEKAGKGHWVVPRKETITAKGKGEMKTYWLLCKDTAMSQVSGDSGFSDRIEDLSSLAKTAKPVAEVKESTQNLPESTVMNKKMSRLVEWNVEVLAGSLRLIVARRGNETPEKVPSIVKRLESQILSRPGMVLDEVEEIVSLPKFDGKYTGAYVDPHSVQLPLEVMDQLRDYVATIAGNYRENRKFYIMCL